MAEKKVIVVVESTAAMGPYWDTLQVDYLNKIVKSLCGNEPAVSKAEFALVTYHTHGIYSPVLVQRSGWTRDPEVFLDWLSSISFSGGGFNDAAVAEGLAEALMMFSPSQSESPNQKNVDMPMHCILVAASNPYPLKRPIYVPKKNESIDSESGNQFYDAEAVAKAFPQFFISLSVICPRNLLKIKAIYNAGKQNNGAADSPVDAKPPLVLISEGFMEARGALSPSGTNLPSNQSHVKVDDVSVAPVTGASPSSLPIANRQPIPAVNVTPATVKVEPVPVKVEPVPVKVERGVKIELGTTSSGPTGQNVFSSGPPVITSSGYLTAPTQVGQQSSLALLMSATSQPLANIQGAVMGQQVPRMNPGNLAGAQMLHGGVNINENIMNGVGQSGVSSGTGAVMIPTPGMPQQVQSGMQPLVNNAAATNMPVSQQTTSAQPPKYIKAWEGTLTGLRQGKPVFISKLEGYRSSAASETLTADWPTGMQIFRLIPQEHMNNKQYIGKADFLVFRAMNQHGFLGQLKEKKQCAVIQLPSQTLLLSVSDKPCRLIGMIFPKEMVVTKPSLSSQQQQQQMQQQHQQMQSQQQQQLSHMQQQQLSHHQQLPQQQQMVGAGRGQNHVQDPGRSQTVSQGQVSSQGATNIGRGNFMS